MACSCVDLGRRDFQHASHDEGERLNEYRRKGDAPHDAMREMALRDGNQEPQHCQNRERDEHDSVGIDALVAVAVAAVATDDEPRAAKSESQNRPNERLMPGNYGSDIFRLFACRGGFFGRGLLVWGAQRGRRRLVRLSDHVIPCFRGSL